MSNEIVESVFESVSNCLGDTIEYIYKDGSRQSIVGLYFSDFSVMDIEAGVEISSDTPGFEIILSDLTSFPMEGDKIEHESTTYLIIDVKTKENVLAKLFIREISE